MVIITIHSKIRLTSLHIIGGGGGGGNGPHNKILLLKNKILPYKDIYGERKGNYWSVSSSPKSDTGYVAIPKRTALTNVISTSTLLMIHLFMTASPVIPCADHPLSYHVQTTPCHTMCRPPPVIPCADHPLSYHVQTTPCHTMCRPPPVIPCADHPLSYHVQTTPCHTMCRPHPLNW